jgi:hypothetical protein
MKHSIVNGRPTRIIGVVHVGVGRLLVLSAGQLDCGSLHSCVCNSCIAITKLRFRCCSEREGRKVIGTPELKLPEKVYCTGLGDRWYLQ